MRAKGMKGNEAQRQRLDLVLHLQELFLAKIVETELSRCDMDNLPVIKLEPELFRQDTGQLTPTSTILAADRNDWIITHRKFLPVNVNVF